ncbi:MAG: nucleotidyltransferase [Clostridia bacterium]|nr:nucleotidyltransferase [Clostridia bacterium]
MKVAGIISEYNPFHNGHLYHIQETKRRTDADYIICVMNGNFMQRGEAALVNKWARTEMALKGGADIVVELPVIFGVQSGELFSYAGVKILDSLNIVDFISFGSECGNIQSLNKIADILKDEPSAYKRLLKGYLKKGHSFAKARQQAISHYLNEDMSSIISSPNNILAIEYLKALKRIDSNMTPITIKRKGASYSSHRLNKKISSATAIRTLIKNNSIKSKELENNMPMPILEILHREFEMGRGPIFLDSFEQIVLYELRKKDPDNLLKYMDISEGLENRILRNSKKYGFLRELLRKTKTKRYAYTRLSRILVNIMLDITENKIKLLMQNGGPQYIRILGFSRNATHLVSYINKNSSLPVINKIPKHLNISNKLLIEMIQKEIFATDIYTLGYQNERERRAGMDHIMKPVIL